MKSSSSQHHHHSTLNYPAGEAPLTLCFYCHSQQRADALFSPRVLETCVPCLCSSGLPQSGRGDQQPKSTETRRKDVNFRRKDETEKSNDCVFTYLLVIFIQHFADLWFQSCDCERSLAKMQNEYKHRTAYITARLK